MTAIEVCGRWWRRPRTRHLPVAGADQHVVALVTTELRMSEICRLMLSGVIAVLRVVLDLLLAPGGRSPRSPPLHRAGDRVGIEDDAGRRRLRAARPMVWISEVSERKKAFLVGVEDRDQRAFRNVEAPRATGLMPTSHVERAEPEIADDLDALQRVDVGMHIAHADAPARADIRSGPSAHALWSAP